MKRTFATGSFILLFGLYAVSFSGLAAEEIPPAALARAKGTADNLTKDLVGLLFSTLDAEGPAGAVRICADVAQESDRQGGRRQGQELDHPGL